VQRSPGVEAHHIIPWEDHGHTDLPNLALLCRYHHGVTHRTGWTMNAEKAGSFTWTTPTGRTLTNTRRHHLPAA
jgi:HNH endonuclease